MKKPAFLYLVPRVLKRDPTADEMATWRPWLTRQLQDLNPNLDVGLGKLAGCRSPIRGGEERPQER